jgi:hypothetical protein
VGDGKVNEPNHEKVKLQEQKVDKGPKGPSEPKVQKMEESDVHLSASKEEEVLYLCKLICRLEKNKLYITLLMLSLK